VSEIGYGCLLPDAAWQFNGHIITTVCDDLVTTCNHTDSLTTVCDDLVTTCNHTDSLTMNQEALSNTISYALN